MPMTLFEYEPNYILSKRVFSLEAKDAEQVSSKKNFRPVKYFFLDRGRRSGRRWLSGSRIRGSDTTLSPRQNFKKISRGCKQWGVTA